LTQHISRSLGDCPVGAGKEDVRKPVVGLSRIPVSKYLFREVTLIKRLSRIIAAATHARMIQQDLTIGKAMRKRAQIGPASRRYADPDSFAHHAAFRLRWMLPQAWRYGCAKPSVVRGPHSERRLNAAQLNPSLLIQRFNSEIRFAASRLQTKNNSQSIKVKPNLTR
jgi:hypothetical protein